MSSFRRHGRKAPIIICLVCTAVVAALYYLQFPPLHNAEFYTEDTLLRSGKKAPLDPRIVFVAIDNNSIKLDQLDPAVVEASPALKLMQQGWPWPRAVYPLILERLFNAGAKVVAMDLMFPTQREGDDAFRAALDKYHGQVVVGSNFVQGARSNGGTNTFQVPSSTLIPQTSPQDDRIGFVNFWPDDDEVIRRASYARTMTSIFHDPPEAGEEVYDSLAARVLKKFGRGDLVPGQESRRFRFAGSPGVFEPHSVCDLFVPESWSSPEFDDGKVFRDKIVVLGPLGDFLKDYVQSPYQSPPMPGPELHMNAINAALSGSFLRDTPVVAQYLLIAGAGLFTWLLCIWFPAPLWRLALLLLVCAGWLVIAQLLYNYASLCLFTFPPLVVLGSSGVCCLSWDFFMEQREKARVRGTLERYVSKQAVREIIDNPASFFNKLGGERRPVAVLFTDLRGFTSMTEEAENEHALIAQLNEYFSVMVEPILANHGSLDKYIGDAIMAVWGNIQSHGAAEDIRHAVIAALKMRESLPKLNEQWAAAGKKPLTMGMGINYGEVIVGNLGSKQQMNFTVIGDAVNLASRIEGTTKEYGVDFLVGEDAANLVKDYFLMQTGGLTQVKGRKQPVELFYVIGERPAVVEPRQEEYLRVYGEGMALYIKGDFVAALEKFKRSLELHPPDALAKVYIERCAILAKEPVPEGWNGVFVMKGK